MQVALSSKAAVAPSALRAPSNGTQRVSMKARNTYQVGGAAGRRDTGGLWLRWLIAPAGAA